jgi:hypothetical protein
MPSAPVAALVRPFHRDRQTEQKYINSPWRSAAGPPRLSYGFELYTYSINPSPNGNATADGIIEGQVKIVRQNDGIRQHQPNASRREVSYHAFDTESSLKQDHACLRILMPRRRPSLDTSEFRRSQVPIPGDTILLELRQAQPSLGLKCVQALNARIFSPKRECNALQSLALEPMCLGAIYHRIEHATETWRVNTYQTNRRFALPSSGTSVSNAVVAAVSKSATISKTNRQVKRRRHLVACSLFSAIVKSHPPSPSRLGVARGPLCQNVPSKTAISSDGDGSGGTMMCLPSLLVQSHWGRRLIGKA